MDKCAPGFMLRQTEGMPDMFKSSSTALILLGILAVIVGITAVAWPGVTILALVILFAIYAFMAAGLQAARAFRSRAAGPVLGHLLLGVVDLVAGVIALAWPVPTAFVLVIVVAAWALVGGFAEIFAGFQTGETAGTRTLVLHRRAGVGRVRHRALRAAWRWRGHPRAAVRPVQHDLRVLADHDGHPRPPAGQVRLEDRNRSIQLDESSHPVTCIKFRLLSALRLRRWGRETKSFS